jgi:hypothetical protein
MMVVKQELQIQLATIKGLPWVWCAQDDEEPEKGEGSEDDDEGKVSKRKHKMESRLKIAELKQTCPRPEVVEVWDVTAQDPRLLVYLKVRRSSLTLINFTQHMYMLHDGGRREPGSCFPDLHQNLYPHLASASGLREPSEDWLLTLEAEGGLPLD